MGLGRIMPKKKYKTLIHINVTEDEKYSLDQLGGPTEGFRKLYAFWYANYSIWEDAEKKRKRIEEKINGLK
jgi:hypothetical protein